MASTEPSWDEMVATNQRGLDDYWRHQDIERELARRVVGDEDRKRKSRKKPATTVNSDGEFEVNPLKRQRQQFTNTGSISDSDSTDTKPTNSLQPYLNEQVSSIDLVQPPTLHVNPPNRQRNGKNSACERCRGMRLRCDPNPDGDSNGPCRRCATAAPRKGIVCSHTTTVAMPVIKDVFRPEQLSSQIAKDRVSKSTRKSEDNTRSINLLGSDMVSYINTKRPRTNLKQYIVQPKLPQVLHKAAIQTMSQAISQAVSYTTTPAMMQPPGCPVHESPLQLVISYVRESGDIDPIEQLQARAKVHYEFYMQRYWRVLFPQCTCKPVFEPIVQKRLPSNTDISKSQHEGIQLLRKSLITAAAIHGSTTIIISQADGLTTNVAILPEFFKHVNHRADLKLFIIYNDLEFVEISVSSLIDRVTHINDGNLVESEGFSNIDIFLRRANAGGMGKLQMSEGSLINRQAGLHRRNHKTLTMTAPPSTGIPGSIAVSMISVSNPKLGQTAQLIQMDPVSKEKRLSDALEHRLLRVQLEYDDDQISCPSPGCTQRFLDIDSLVQHLATKVVKIPGHNGDKDKKKCPLCPNLLSNSQTMKDHLLRHLPPSFPCRFCDVTKRTQRAIEKHEDDKHSGKTKPPPPKFQCPICPDVILAQTPFRKHMKTHEDGYEGPNYVNCDQCGLPVREEYVGWHKKSGCSHRPVHSLVVCEICGHRVDQYQYSKHVRKHEINGEVKDFALKVGFGETGGL